MVFGYDDGRFGPNDKITREQAMAMIARAMGITGLEVEPPMEKRMKFLKSSAMQ